MIYVSPIILICSIYRDSLQVDQDSLILETMKHILVDFIVHGIGGPHENCDIFSYFDPRKIFSLEFDDQDYSLSRCNISNDESIESVRIILKRIICFSFVSTDLCISVRKESVRPNCSCRFN